MASRRDVPRTSRSEGASPTESAPTVFPPADSAKRRPPPRRAAATPKPESGAPSRAAPTPEAASEGRSSSAARARVDVSHDARYQMIAEAAYLRAERRGFMPGNEVEDWLAAEAEVDRLLAAEHVTTSQ